MKTICRLANFEVPNVSLYLFEDSITVTIGDTKTTISDSEGVELYIADCTTSNSVLYENVTDPGDWDGWKYTYTTDGGWVLNPDYPYDQPSEDA